MGSYCTIEWVYSTAYLGIRAPIAATYPTSRATWHGLWFSAEREMSRRRQVLRSRQSMLATGIERNAVGN